MTRITAKIEASNAAEQGAKGGKAKTQAKTQAAIENGKKGGRPRTNTVGMTDEMAAAMLEGKPIRVMLDPKALIPYANNTKLHPDEQIDKIAASIAAYGFDQDIVVDHNLVIIKGHGRRLGSLKLNLAQVPVTIRYDLNKHQADAARIADNRTAESEWDRPMLALELKSLAASEVDLLPLGFDSEELHDLLTFQVEFLPIEDNSPGGDVIKGFTPTIVQPGDIWDLGDHNLRVEGTELYALDIMIKSWQKATKKKALCEGIEFEEVGRRRGVLDTPKLGD